MGYPAGINDIMRGIWALDHPVPQPPAIRQLASVIVTIIPRPPDLMPDQRPRRGPYARPQDRSPRPADHRPGQRPSARAGKRSIGGRRFASGKTSANKKSDGGNGDEVFHKGKVRQRGFRICGARRMPRRMPIPDGRGPAIIQTIRCRRSGCQFLSTHGFPRTRQIAVQKCNLLRFGHRGQQAPRFGSQPTGQSQRVKSFFSSP